MDLLSFVIGISSTLFIIVNLTLFLSWRKNAMRIKNLERNLDFMDRNSHENSKTLDYELSRIREDLEKSLNSIERNSHENFRTLDDELSRIRENIDNLRSNI